MKKKTLSIILLLTIGLFLLAFCKNGDYLFGSTTDWLNQHLLFADYFRNLFYKTGNFFPNIALHLGGGMNIFALSYYGLYSPWLTLSYLFPNISMVTYMQAINMVTYLASIILIYAFFIHKKYSNNVAFVGSVLFATASPVLYHFHRQIMFVNYLPFLLMGFFGVDAYLSKKKKSLLALSVFLLCITSYFYSVSALLVLGLYFLYSYFQKEKKITKEKIGTIFLPFLGTLFLGVLMAAFLLVPSLLALLNGRGTSTSTNFLNYFIPNLSLGNLLYQNYSMGLPIIALVTLLVGIFAHKKEIKYLSIFLLCLFIFPLFSFILNGGLYARGKIFIPFIPLVLLLVVDFLENLPQREKEIPWRTIIILLVVPLTIGYLTQVSDKSYHLVFLGEIALLLIAIYLSHVKKDYKFFLLVPLLVALPMCYLVNHDENYVLLSDYDSKAQEEIRNFSEEIGANNSEFYRMNNLYDTYNTMNQITSLDTYQTSIYSSLENPWYKEFYLGVMKNPEPENNYLMLTNSLNPIFQSLMGVRYIISGTEPIGYTLKEEGTFVNLYENENVLPVFYATSKLYPANLFSYLRYPNNVTTLMNYAVVNQGNASVFSESLVESDLGIKENLEGLHVIEEDKETRTIPLKKTLQNQIIFVSFDVTPDKSCTEGESKFITINGITNQQSCDNWIYGNQNHTFYYQIATGESLDQLTLTFTKGVYEIQNVKVYNVSTTFLNNYQKSVTPMEDINVQGDKITGSITLNQDGYFITSLPYDEGYQIKVDGKDTSKEIVNTAFLGFPLAKGEHVIEITYESPGHSLGIILSSVGFIAFGIITIVSYLPKKVDKIKKKPARKV